MCACEYLTEEYKRGDFLRDFLISVTAGCEAVAMPRRTDTPNVWAVPLVRALRLCTSDKVSSDSQSK
jgi:hypothetical protein